MHIPKFKFSRLLAMFVAAAFLFQLVSVILLFPEKANAQGMPVIDASKNVQDAGFEVKRVVEKATDKALGTTEDRIFKGLLLSASLTLRNAVVKVARLAATQTYEWATTGDWGEEPMFYDQAFGIFTQDLEDYFVAQFITNLRNVAWDATGFDICDPGIDQVKLQIVLGLDYKSMKDKQRAKPDCSMKVLTENWDNFIETMNQQARAYSNNPAAASILTVQNAMEVSFSKKSSDIGIYLTLQDELARQQERQRLAAENQRKENLGAKSVTTLGGDVIKTPAFLTRGHLEDEVTAMKEANQDELRASENAIDDIPAAFAGAFLTTFISKGFTDLMQKKLFEDGLVKNSTSYNPQARLYDQKKQLSKDISKIKTVDYTYKTKQIDLLTEFVSCPQDRQGNNCVMDDTFADAVRRATQEQPMTLQEAIDSQAINGNLPLINEADGRNKSNDCYEMGWCYSNLVKLRNARIIPIGWEIAASRVNLGESVSLNYVKDLFNCTDKTNADCVRFGKLIDPNWVLKYPATQCNALVYGSQLVSSGANARSEVCADQQSCVKYNDRGKCMAWGYCAAEKSVFRLGGDECQGQFDSCRALESRQGDSVNLLANTLDRTGCDATNVGCKWYSSAMKQTDGVWGWNPKAPQVYLDKNIENKECGPASEGCNKFVELKPGYGVNLVKNGNFENYSGVADDGLANNYLPGWGGAANHEIVSTTAYNGGGSLKVSGFVSFPDILLAPKNSVRYLAVSAQIKKDTALSTAKIIPILLTSQVTLVENSERAIGVEDAATDWIKYYAIYKISPVRKLPDDTVQTSLVEKVNFSLIANSGAILVDDILVEEITSPALNEMHEFSAYGSVLNAYIKKAPDYFSCYDTQGANAVYGRPKTESEINYANDARKSGLAKGCEGFAKLCTAEEVGCEAYAPSDRGRTMYGTVSFGDYCPQACAGYGTYNQAPTYFENGDFPLYFIPSSAGTCSADAAGCDEFTNLDALASGGEGREYYSEIKHCAKLPDKAEECASFYTWSGSDVTGFQLQAYKLQKDPAKPNVPDVAVTAEEEASMAEICNSSVFLAKSNPDCREFYAEDGTVSYRLLSKTITCSEDCRAYRRTEAYATAADCQARNGEVRGTECVFWTIPSEGKTCDAKNAGCREYKGNFSGDAFELYSNDFNKGDISKLQGSSMLQPVTRADGQYLQVGVLQLNTCNPGGGIVSKVYTKSESVPMSTTGDYEISFWVKGNAGQPFTVDIREANNLNRDPAIKVGDGEFTEDWKFFTYNFTANDNFVATPHSIGIRAGNCDVFLLENLKIVKVIDKNYLIKNSWKTPALCDNALGYSPADEADRKIPQAQLGCREYNDRAKTVHYLKSFSGLCSSTRVGCEAMIDTKNSATSESVEVPLAPNLVCERNRISYLNDQAYWGANKRIDLTTPGTYNSNDKNCVYKVIDKTTGVVSEKTVAFANACVNAGTWNVALETCVEDTPLESSDSIIYLVNSKDVQCRSAEKGCTAFGLPTLSVDDTGSLVPDPARWATQYYKLDPDTYTAPDSPLCGEVDVGCEEYKDEKATAFYFRNPGEKVCEWKKASRGGEMVYDWYKKGTNEQCDSKSYYDDGNKQLVRNTDVNYTGWAGECDSSANMCTAFVDPTDKTQSENGMAYYYINDESIDRTSCTSVDRKGGCLLMNDTSMTKLGGVPDLKYTAFFSYSDASLKNSKVPPAKYENLGNFESFFMAAIEYIVTGGQNDFNTIWSRWNRSAEANPLDCATEDKFCPSFEECMTYNESVVDCVTKSQAPGPGQCTATKLACSFDKLVKNDSNSIIKVVRDRECASWYGCIYKHWAWDSGKNKYVEVCDNLGLCDAVTTGSSSDSAQCANFLTAPDDHNLLTQNVPMETNYTTRNIGWNNLEYSGSAIPKLAPLQFYGSAEIDRGGESLPEYHLVNKNVGETCDNNEDCAEFCGYPAGQEPETNKCGCRGNVCIKAAYGTNLYDPDSSPLCRAYPKEDSPFPKSVKTSAAFSNVNSLYVDIQEKNNVDYACAYREVNYGGTLTKYLPNSPVYQPIEQNGFCQDEPDTPCDCNVVAGDNGTPVKIETKSMCNSTDCASGDGQPGMCLRYEKSKDIRYRGWEGYCLEYDLSLQKNNNPDLHPCLTWYPLDSMAGLQDLQNDYREAGVDTSQYSGGPYYCTESRNWEKRQPYLAHLRGSIDCDGGEYNGELNVDKATVISYYNSWLLYDMYLGFMDENETPTEYPFASINLSSEESDTPNCNDFVSDPAPKDGRPGLFSCLFPKEESWQDCIDNCSLACVPNAVTGEVATGGACLALCRGSCETTRIFSNLLDSFCSNANNGNRVRMPNNLSCDANYDVGPLRSLSRETYPSGATTDEEDTFEFEYACIPSSMNTDLATYPAEVYKPEKPYIGWYPNYSGSTALSVRSSWQRGNTAHQVSYDEDTEPDCMSFISVGEKAVGQPGTETKAHTNYLYKSQADNQASCAPYGALAYKGQLSIAEKFKEDSASGIKLYNMFTNADGCGGLGEGGYYGGSVVTLEELKKRFARFYLSGSHEQENTRTNQGTCRSVNVANPMNGKVCNTENPKCDGASEYPSEYKQRTCRTDASKKCFTDYDCDNRLPAMNNLNACTSSNNDDTSCFTECTGSVVTSNINIPDQCPGGFWYQDCDAMFNGCDPNSWNRTYICIGYRFSDGSGTKNTDSNDTRVVVDPGAVCIGHEVPSWHEDSFYTIEDYAPTHDVTNNRLDSNGRLAVPIVAAALPTGRLDENGRAMYGALPGTLTVNNFIEGDVVHHGNSLLTELKFFAWAHDDRMPIKSVNVVWGDQNPFSPAPNGTWKNHKPMCQKSTQPGMGECKKGANRYQGYSCLTNDDCAGLGTDYSCDMGVASDDFGDTAEACDPTFFQYTATYNCPDPMLLDPCTDTKNTNCRIEYQGETACVFVPAVQVKDNWGWCNGGGGDCGGVDQGCYADGLLGDQCALDDGDFNDENNTRFDGRIIVIPPAK